MKKKSEISVKKAAQIAFDHQSETFSALSLCHYVRSLTRRMELMDGTILRRLREVRAKDQNYQYKCIDTENALYKKLKHMAS